MNVDLYKHLLLSFIVAYRAVPRNNTKRTQRTVSAQLSYAKSSGTPSARSRQGSNVLRAAVGEWKAAR